jgi:hypothetical protein
MQKWEYHLEYIGSISTDREKIIRLNELGELGWELVTVSTEYSGQSNATWFKRPI